jgi:hypothetical protein
MVKEREREREREREGGEEKKGRMAKDHRKWKMQRREGGRRRKVDQYPSLPLSLFLSLSPSLPPFHLPLPSPPSTKSQDRHHLTLTSGRKKKITTSTRTFTNGWFLQALIHALLLFLCLTSVSCVSERDYRILQIPSASGIKEVRAAHRKLSLKAS